MKLALISDIHSNLEGLEACLEKCAALAPEQIVFLGDFVGYGAEPEAVVRLVMQLVERGATAVLGNHDKAALTSAAGLNQHAARALEYSRSKLSGASMAFLESLPLTAQREDLCFVHADASAPARWNYVLSVDDAQRSLIATDARVTFCGHTHMPQLYCMTATGKIAAHKPVTNVAVPLLEQRQWLAVIGSAGQPRDGNPAAAFANYDSSTRELTFRRAPYDVERTVAKIRDAGLPDVLAVRLLVGK